MGSVGFISGIELNVIVPFDYASVSDLIGGEEPVVIDTDGDGWWDGIESVINFNN